MLKLKPHGLRSSGFWPPALHRIGFYKVLTGLFDELKGLLVSV